MKRLIIIPPLFCTVMVLMLYGGQSSARFCRYKAVEAYEVRPGLLMTPRFSATGEVCELGLEKRQYSPEMVYLNPDLSSSEVDEVLGEIVPVSERGKKLEDFPANMAVQSGQGITFQSDFENVQIRKYAAILPSKKRKEIRAEFVVVTVKWNNRDCSR